MDQNQKEEVAAFKYSLISKVVNRITPISPGEIKDWFKAIANEPRSIPYSSRKSISIRSLERYKELYELHGYQGLVPKDSTLRGFHTVLQSVLDEAVKMRLEIPDRSVEQIIFSLERNGLILKGELSKSSLSRYFKSINLQRSKVLKNGNSSEGFKRFEASLPNILWQSDFKHAVYLSSPLNSKLKIRTKLCCIIDDNSRLIVHGQFYWDEKVPALEDCLKRAIMKYGIPEQFYCDNGSAFNSKHLSNICARLGIRLSHSRPYKPSGRGKIERFFQFVDSSFIPEAYSLIEAKKIITLEDLNKQFNIWLEGYYHLRKHSSIKDTPLARFEANKPVTRHIPHDLLTKMFLLGEERQVDKAGCISLNSIIYDVGPDHAGCKIEARYDSFDLSVIEVWRDNIFSNQAKALNPSGNFNNYSGRHREFNTPLQILKKQSEDSNVAFEEVSSFLDAAKTNAYESFEQLKLSYVMEENENENRTV